MSEEQSIEIVANGDFNNISPKKALNDGNFIIVSKNFKDGRELDGKWGKIYSCGVKYKDTDVSFILNAKEHVLYEPLGGIDDKIKITKYKDVITNYKTGMEMLVPKLKFELVE